MSGIADLINPSQADEGAHVWLEVPPGYLRLPTGDVERTMSAVEETTRELVPEGQRELFATLVGAFTYFLTELRRLRTVYCGIGRHFAEDGTPVTSSLVISLQSFPEKRNPRVILGDLVRADADADEVGQADLVDLANGPALFFERVRHLPAPQIPRQESSGDTDVYQLRAAVPSADGTRLVVLEFATPYLSYGPEFRTMMVLTANSISFEAPVVPPAADEQGASIADIIRGL